MRYPTFKNTEQVIPAIAASKIEFAALLLTMILSNTAPWETAMMEKMDAMSALKPQKYHRPLRPTQEQHAIPEFKGTFSVDLIRKGRVLDF